MEKRHSRLVYLVVAAHPAFQVGQVAVGIEGLDLGSVVAWKTFNGNKGILTGSTAATTHHVDASTARHRLVVRDAHHTAIYKFTGTYAKPVSVVLHLPLLIS